MAALTREAIAWQFSLTNDGLADELPLERLLESWVTTKTDGTGLGLAIVQRIINAHHGHIKLDSPASQRLRVQLWLKEFPVQGPSAH